MKTPLVQMLLLVLAIFCLFSCTIIPTHVLRTSFTCNKERKERVMFSHQKWSISSYNGTARNFCRYFIYRSPNLSKCALSHLIYDNNHYVGISNARTFIEVDSVAPGTHIFSSARATHSFVSFVLEPQKNYIIQAKASDMILKGVLEIMSKEEIEEELKHPYFRMKFEKHGLHLEDF